MKILLHSRSMQNTYTTLRLLLNKLTADHSAFIYELVNTEGWIKFIGDRNVTDHESAKAYIQKILDNSNVTYWVVCTKEAQTPTGIITFIKRDYLTYPDIGFAFLPVHSGKGYAYEAAKTVLSDALANNGNTRVLATTVPGNTQSIRLLEKLGFELEEEIEQEGEMLLVYATPLSGER